MITKDRKKDREKVISLYASGVPIETIIEKTTYSKRTIYKILKQDGVIPVFCDKPKKSDLIKNYTGIIPGDTIIAKTIVIMNAIEKGELPNTPNYKQIYSYFDGLYKKYYEYINSNINK